MIQSVVLASAAAGVLTAAAVIGITGLLIAVLLGVAANVFEVPVDEKAIAIRDVLPGANCGGCGYAGCDAMAAAIAAGEAPVNGCPVGGPAVADKIGEIMGVSAGEDVKKVAFVKCAGTCDKASVKANYYGISDCRSAAAIPAAAIKHVHTAAWDLVLVLQRVASMRFILSMALRLWIKKSALLVANVLRNVQII